MHEDGTPLSAHARGGVVVEHDEHVVESIRPPKALGARRIGVLHQAVVIAVGRGIAPAIIAAQWPDRQTGARTQNAIGAIEDPKKRPGSGRGGAITLTLAHADPGASEGAGKRQIAKLQPTTSGAGARREGRQPPRRT